jgi:ubiquinone/menaquinone biosynthesis C-methylase UbiE
MINNIIFNQYVKRYDSWYDKNSFAYLSELAAIKKVILRNGKGLEIGVGTGRFAAPLGIQFGIDLSGKMLEIAQKRGVKVILANGENLPYSDLSFDYIAVINALCFVNDAKKVLAEAERVLKKKGKIILAIIDRQSFLGKFYRKKKSKFYQQVKFFNVNECTYLLKLVGFKNFSYYQAIFQFPEKMMLIEPPQKGFGKGGFVIIAAQK